MAALSGITAVRPTDSTILASRAPVVYGATASAGQSAYRDAADSKYKLADSNASVATAAAVGIFVTPGVDTGYGYVATGGSIILVGTTMVVGTVYCVGTTAGSIVPISDLTTGDYVTILGTAATATQLDLAIKASGIVKP
jgi:uncharacterized membrane protein YgdD (TMEM256/DUF423 family)